ncbi:GNAT family N-acetyltransferase [Brevifollis gellanilyticus]|uniref:GNAT family N-acetyltransferase n=1 Tax=Brevifollis gellanilyticus TaxID=748831 RepID=UPI0011BE9C4C|nr:GNAT family N-acetyltransferase [Brevifollis gellanilyticus]
MKSSSFAPRDLVLGDGSIGQIRPLGPADRDALIEGFDSLSPESRIRRFFFEKKALSDQELHALTHPDGVDHIALGLAVAIEGRPEPLPIGVARCFRSQDDLELAEVALITRDDWQGAGAGTALMQALAEAAWNVGIRRWFGALFCDNQTIRNLLSRVGDLSDDRAIGSGVVEVLCDLYPPVQPEPAVSTEVE